MKPLTLALAASLFASTSVLAQDAVLEAGRERSEAFLAGDLASIWEDMAADMQGALGTLEAFETFHADVSETLGEEAEILDEQVLSNEGYEVYLRVGRWTDFDTPVLMQWAFDPEGQIAGFSIQPQLQAADSAYLDYQTQASFRLPFEGAWYVFWGGRAIEENYHAVDPAQRFAYDFLVLEDGQSHSGDPQALDSYHCWGRDILAPADGRVVTVVDDLPDQPIGGSDPENPAGNHVVIEVAENEYAFLAHLQQGSIQVAEGDEVTQGDVLGQCGNSGNTSEPHLHFHLQTTPDLFEGEGLPVAFLDYTADGESIPRGEPVRGQTVEADAQP